MTGRFLTELEKKYQEKFPKDGALPYYFQSEEKHFEKLLEQAIKRGSSVTKDEIINAYGSKEAYESEREYLKEWGYPDA